MGDTFYRQWFDVKLTRWWLAQWRTVLAGVEELEAAICMQGKHFLYGWNSPTQFSHYPSHPI